MPICLITHGSWWDEWFNLVMYWSQSALCYNGRHQRMGSDLDSSSTEVIQCCIDIANLVASLEFIYLTHWGQDHIDAILRQHFQKHFLEWKCLNFNHNFTKFVPKCPINNLSALVRMMTWHRPGHKLLCEMMMIIFSDPYMHHSASMK